MKTSHLEIFVKLSSIVLAITQIQAAQELSPTEMKIGITPKREDVVTALRMHGGNIHNVKSETFLADKELIMMALQYVLDDFRYASDKLKDDFDFVVEIMEQWAKEEKAKYESTYSESWRRTNPFTLDVRGAGTWSPLQYASSRIKNLLLADPSHYCK